MFYWVFTLWLNLKNATYNSLICLILLFETSPRCLLCWTGYIAARLSSIGRKKVWVRGLQHTISYNKVQWTKDQHYFTQALKYYVTPNNHTDSSCYARLLSNSCHACQNRLMTNFLMWYFDNYGFCSLFRPNMKQINASICHGPYTHSLGGRYALTPVLLHMHRVVWKKDRQTILYGGLPEIWKCVSPTGCWYSHQHFFTHPPKNKDNYKLTHFAAHSA